MHLHPLSSSVQASDSAAGSGIFSDVQARARWFDASVCVDTISSHNPGTFRQQDCFFTTKAWFHKSGHADITGVCNTKITA